MKTETKLQPCPHIFPAIERILDGDHKRGIFMWYVRKHIEKCNHCKDTLTALQCYQDAVRQAFDEASAGDIGVTQDELGAILREIE